MIIYLDMCSLQRPLDSKLQVRINVEAEAVLNIIKIWEIKQVKLVSSDALLFEVQRITLPERKAYVMEIL